MSKFDLMTDNELYHYIVDRINKKNTYWSMADDTLWSRESVKQAPFDMAMARSLLANSSSNDPDEEEMVDIMNYYWGYVPKDLRQKPEGMPKVDQSVCRSHVWIDVTLFQTSHKRCLYCDIKQTSVEEKK